MQLCTQKYITRRPLNPPLRNAMTRISLRLETSVTFLLHVFHVLLWEPMAARTLTEVTRLPCT